MSQPLLLLGNPWYKYGSTARTLSTNQIAWSVVQHLKCSYMAGLPNKMVKSLAKVDTLKTLASKCVIIIMIIIKT